LSAVLKLSCWGDERGKKPKLSAILKNAWYLVCKTLFCLFIMCIIVIMKFGKNKNLNCCVDDDGWILVNVKDKKKGLKRIKNNRFDTLKPAKESGHLDYLLSIFQYTFFIIFSFPIFYSVSDISFVLHPYFSQILAGYDKNSLCWYHCRAYSRFSQEK
jgi:hypothetical protein